MAEVATESAMTADETEVVTEAIGYVDRGNDDHCYYGKMDDDSSFVNNG